MVVQKQRERGNWRVRVIKVVGAAALAGLIGYVAVDIVFRGCEDICSLFDSTPEYTFTIPVGDGKDGAPTSNYAAQLFTRYDRYLREGKKELDFRPENTDKMLFCVKFGPVSGSVEDVFKRFLIKYAGCIKTTEVSQQRLITVSPVWGNRDLIRGKSGQFWCRCSPEKIDEADKPLVFAPVSGE